MSKLHRKRDVALYAPLVLLPFAWFALSACIDEAMIIGAISPRPDASYGGTSVYNNPDGTTQYTGAGGNVVCAGGRYAGGAGATPAVAQDIRNRIGWDKQELNAERQRLDQCKGREVNSQEQADAAAGCNRARLSQLYAQSRTLVSFDDQKKLDPEIRAQESACRGADDNYRYGPCTRSTLDAARQRIATLENSIKADEARLNEVNNCIKDKERQADAAQRPRIDPSIILMNPGLYGSRPRHQSRPPSSGSQQHKD